MRKLITIAFILCMLLGCSALAEEDLVTYKLDEMAYALPASYELDFGDFDVAFYTNDSGAELNIFISELSEEEAQVFSYEQWNEDVYLETFTLEYRDIGDYSGVVGMNEYEYNNQALTERVFVCLVNGKVYMVIEYIPSPTMKHFDFEEFVKTITFETEE